MTDAEGMFMGISSLGIRKGGLPNSWYSDNRVEAFGVWFRYGGAHHIVMSAFGVFFIHVLWFLLSTK